MQISTILRFFAVCAMILGGHPSALYSADFFEIKGLEPVFKEDKNIQFATDAKNNLKREFHPCMKAELEAAEDVFTKDLVVKAYFFDAAGQSLGSAVGPGMVAREGDDAYALPVILKKKKRMEVYFLLPAGLGTKKDWKCLAVFGKPTACSVDVYPSREDWKKMNFAEKAYVGKTIEKVMMDTTPKTLDPVIEEIVETGVPAQPKITLFMRMPPGVSDMKQIKGVLGMCLLANNVNEVKRKLQGLDGETDVSGVLKFATEENLLILCWGSTRMWDPTKNWSELANGEQKQYEKTFDAVASAWSRKVDTLGKKYGFDSRNMLLMGSSGAAQSALRLALQQPQHFLAVHAHIPSSFDAPQPSGKTIMWLLTTGEMEAGYKRSVEFYQNCKAMDYKIIYKAIPNLAHQPSVIADRLEVEFFKYALQLKQENVKTVNTPNTVGSSLKDFQKPYAYGDFVNHTAVPADKIMQIPLKLRVALPTERIAIAWMGKP